MGHEKVVGVNTRHVHTCQLFLCFLYHVRAESRGIIKTSIVSFKLNRVLSKPTHTLRTVARDNQNISGLSNFIKFQMLKVYTI